MSKSSRVSVCLWLTAVVASMSYAVTPDRIAGPLNNGQTVTLRGNVHHYARQQFDQGLADSSLRFGSLTLLMSPTVSQIKALKTLVAQQQDPRSPNYRKWLTPEQWAERFGTSTADINKITQWLKSQGFTVGTVARGQNWITFGGTAAQVENAFEVQIHRYKVNGEMHVANATAPKIPAALAGIVTGIRGMHDFHLKPTGIKHNFAARPNYDSSNFGDLVAPGDIATLYDINTLYQASTPIDGTGQKLAIIGQTDVYLSDLTDFRTGFGLSAISCTTTTTGTIGVISACNDPHLKYVFVNDSTTTDPLVPLSGDLSEADLDLEWSGAVARNAQLIYVNAPAVLSSQGGLISGGVWDAWHYAVDNKLAPVISMSYGLCEFFDNDITDPNTGQAGTDEVELLAANSFGITFINSSGDFGAAECDSNGTLSATGEATQGIGVGYPASSPEVTGVGGSAIPLANFTSTYWGTTTGTDGGSILLSPGYIPEQAWNDDDEIGQFCTQQPTNSFCEGNGIVDAQSAQNAIGVSSTGGGASNCAMQDPTFSTCVAGFPQPTWQAVSVSGQSAARFSPDISLLATPNFPGYIFCTQLSELNVSGTGSACSPGGPTGIASALNLTDTSGNLTGAIIGGTSASAPTFAGMVTLLNQYVNGSSLAGLGNINPTLYALAVDPSNGAFHPITASSNQVYCVGDTPTTQPWSLQCPVDGLLGFLASSADLTTSYNLVTGLGSVDLDNLATAFNTFTAQAAFSLSPSVTSLTASAGGASNSTTIAVTPLNGFTGTVSFACSNPPSGTTCNFTPTSSTTGTSLSIQTSAGSSYVQNASIVVTGTSGAVVGSTAVSLDVTGGNSTFTLKSNLGTGGTLALTPGATGVVSLGVYSTDGFVTNTGGNSQTIQAVSYTCTGLPSESTCQFLPSTSTQATAVTLNIQTTAATAKADRGVKIFYAALLPGLIGIVFTFGSRRRQTALVRMVTLIAILGFSTLWIASCGGSNGGGGGNAGTPAGSYPMTVNATTSGGPSSSVTFTLQVN